MAASKSAPKRKKPTKSVTKSRNKATAKPSVEELLQKVCIKNKVVYYNEPVSR